MPEFSVAGKVLIAGIVAVFTQAIISGLSLSGGVIDNFELQLAELRPGDPLTEGFRFWEPNKCSTFISYARLNSTTIELHVLTRTGEAITEQIVPGSRRAFFPGCLFTE